MFAIVHDVFNVACTLYAIVVTIPISYVVVPLARSSFEQDLGVLAELATISEAPSVFALDLALKYACPGISAEIPGHAQARCTGCFRLLRRNIVVARLSIQGNACKAI